jgi:small subunit ribosomal protein S27Ae
MLVLFVFRSTIFNFCFPFSSFFPFSESTLHLVLRLRGGGKKHKKKVYTTPKKIAHKKTNVRLSVLKFYKVDSAGKITRLRRECTNPTCGGGTFMAQHFDRQYCGKCHLTYKFAANDNKNAKSDDADKKKGKK